MNLIARNCLHRLPAVVTALLVLMVAVPAYAHHPMGGVTPSSFGEGLLSGIGHPIIGLDHLALRPRYRPVAASFLSRVGWRCRRFFVGATLSGDRASTCMAFSLPVRGESSFRPPSCCSA